MISCRLADAKVRGPAFFEGRAARLGQDGGPLFGTL